jgi:hypothetical protein
MSFRFVLDQLTSRFEVGGHLLPVPHSVLLTEADIGAWKNSTGLSRNELYDRIAIYLARGFHRDELDFGFCDRVVNELLAINSRAGESPPAVFWKVFLAFDSGEFYPGGDRNPDPVETYTRPQIAEVVQQYLLDYPDI